MHSEPPKRRNPRLESYDYSQPGGYFITICTNRKNCLFGKVIENETILNKYGKIAFDRWLNIPKHFSDIELDEFIVMPNHIHGIIFITQAGLMLSGGERANAATIGQVIGTYKAAVSRAINGLRKTGEPVWQRNYYEHIIRRDEYLDKIREYVRCNPFNWVRDPENPEAVKG